MITVEFKFEGLSRHYTLQGDLSRNPVRNGVRLLRGEGFDPQEVSECFLEGSDPDGKPFRYSGLSYLINGLGAEPDEGFAKPLKLTDPVARRGVYKHKTT